MASVALTPISSDEAIIAESGLGRGETVRAARVDGGASANDLLMQFQADLSNVEVVRPRMIETGLRRRVPRGARRGRVGRKG